MQTAKTFHEAAAEIPLRTLDQVKAALAAAAKDGSASYFAAMMLRHGRLTDEARAWVAKEYPLCKS